jgi:hypothetical protein
VAQTKDPNTGITAAAEAVGSALGHVAGAVDRLKADHPHPIDEAREALAQGQTVVKDTAAAASEGVSAVIDTARKAVATVRKTAARSRPRVKRAKKAARRVVARAKKTVRRARKTARRVVAKTKKTVRRAKKAAVRGRSRLRR